MPDGTVANLILPDDAPLAAKHRDDLLQGVTVINGEAQSARWQKDGDGKKVVVEPDLNSRRFRITPGPTAAVGRWRSGWRGTQEEADPLPMPTIASQAKSSASRGNAHALNDQREPKSSGDHTHPFQHFWPNKGSAEWLQYDFDKPHEVSQVEIYWFDDTGRGECRLPASWKLLYRKAGTWVEVNKPSGYGPARATDTT